MKIGWSIFISGYYKSAQEETSGQCWCWSNACETWLSGGHQHDAGRSSSLHQVHAAPNQGLVLLKSFIRKSHSKKKEFIDTFSRQHSFLERSTLYRSSESAPMFWTSWPWPFLVVNSFWARTICGCSRRSRRPPSGRSRASCRGSLSLLLVAPAPVVATARRRRPEQIGRASCRERV